MEQLDGFLHRIDIAYVSMAIALRPEIHTCSGGLGLLAGDTGALLCRSRDAGRVRHAGQPGRRSAPGGRRRDSAQGHRDDARELCAELETMILPPDRGDRPRRSWMMDEAIGEIGSYIDNHRPMRRSASAAYLR